MPDWFRAVVLYTTPKVPPASQDILMDVHSIGSVAASVQPEVLVRKTWASSSSTFIAILSNILITLVGVAAIARAAGPRRTAIVSLCRQRPADHFAFAWLRPRGRMSTNSPTASTISAAAAQPSASECAAFTRRLLQVQEDERRTLARELHDEFGQYLTSIAALAASIDAESARDHVDVKAEAHAIADIVAGMTASLRGTLERLRPPEIDDLGLEGSLRHLIGHWNRWNGNGVWFDAKFADCMPRLEGQPALAVYRIAQECITNAIRHGRPTRVRMSLSRGDRNDLLMVVEDDGGMNDRRLAPGHGVIGMRERVAALGGHIDFCRIVGGFRVAASIPVGSEP